MRVFLRVLLALVSVLLLFVGGVYFVACGPLNEIRAQQLAAKFQREADDAGFGGHLSYRGFTWYKGQGAVDIRAEVGDLEPAEVSDLIRFTRGQRSDGSIRVNRHFSAYERNGVRFRGLGGAFPELFDVAAELAGRDGDVESVFFDQTGGTFTIGLGPCGDAACRVAKAAPVIEAYPQLTRAHQESRDWRANNVLCLRLTYGQEREGRYLTCTGADETVDPQRLTGVLESGEDYTAREIRDTSRTSTG